MMSSHKLVVDVVECCDDDGFYLLVRFDEHVISEFQIGSEGDVIENDNRSEGVKPALEKCLNLNSTHEEKNHAIETKKITIILQID